MKRLLFALLLITAPLAAQHVGPVMPASAVKPSNKPLVWVVDGAGNLRGCSTSMSKTFAADAEIETFNWSHGHRRIVIDQTDYKYARLRGEQLADTILERLRKVPGQRTVLVAHSAGAAVALAAAEALPSQSIDRLVLLAPSVASQYDPRPAAKACREGIDTFISGKDIWALGVGVSLVGTVDGHRAASAAGRYGFEIAKDSREIRTIAWAKDDIKLGHNGGHYGAYAPEYARKQLWPLIAGTNTR